MDFSESDLTNDGERPEREQFNGESTHRVEAQQPEGGQYGERLEYDPAGPFRKARVRTDFCWFVGFIFFNLVWFIIIIYGFSNGNAEKGLQLMDSEGRACGVDPDVKDKPYLVRFNNETCDDCLICWKSCPTVNFDYLFSSRQDQSEPTPEVTHATEKTTATTSGENVIAPKTNHEGNKNSADHEKSGEKTNDEKTKSGEKTNDYEKTKSGEKTKVEKTKSSSQEPESEAVKTKSPSESPKESSTGEKSSKDTNLEKEKEETKANEATASKDKNNESSIDEKSSKDTVMGRDENDDVGTRKKYMICKPEVKLNLVERFPELDYLVKTEKCAKTFSKTPETHTDKRCHNHLHEKLIDSSLYETSRKSRDLANTKFSITGFVFISAIIALLSIFAMRWFALFFIYGAFFIVVGVLIYHTYENIVSDVTTSVLTVLFDCIVIIGLILLVTVYWRKKIFRTCKMIKECSKAITGMMWTVLFALLIAFIYGMILTMGVNLHFALSSFQTPIYKVDLEPDNQCICPPELGYTQDATCDPVTFESVCINAENKQCAASGCYLVGYEPRSLGFLHLINYIGLFWTFWFCLGFADTVLASVFSNWYWTFNKKILTYVTIIEAFWTVGLYHLGTVAFGAIIIQICTIIRCVLSHFCRVLEKSKLPCAPFCLMHLKWVSDLLETFLNYINGRAYVACAMHGNDFLHSARSSYYLMMRNLNKVYRVAETSNWLTFLIALLISIIMANISRSYYQSRTDEVTFERVPTLFVFAGSLLVSWLMLRVVQAAVETIYQCFLEDSERNDGSNDKPFFASEQLFKILYKRQN